MLAFLLLATAPCLLSLEDERVNEQTKREKKRSNKNFFQFFNILKYIEKTQNLKIQTLYPSNVKYHEARLRHTPRPLRGPPGNTKLMLESYTEKSHKIRPQNNRNLGISYRQIRSNIILADAAEFM